jgi:hypothetical protein
MAIGSNSSCALYSAPPRAPTEVSTSWNAGQIALHEAHDTISGSHRVCSGDLLDLCDGLLQSLAGEMGATPSECPDTKPGLECPRVFRRHGQKIFLAYGACMAVGE